MTITSKVYGIIFEELENSPQGIQWAELARIVKEKDPSIHPKTINGLIWKMTDKYPDKVYKPEKGRYRLLRYKSD
ncbi:hypothetical protein HGB25_01510 [Candidatus Saccharibacteria bacterium]|nr:hypothetical protein [Candidatus Saccharibacteria bacterium]